MFYLTKWQHCVTLGVHSVNLVRFYICNVIGTVVLARTSITTGNYHSFLMVRTFKIFSISNFTHITVLLSIITTMHQMSRTYISSNWKFVPFEQHLPIIPTPQPLATTILHFFNEFDFLRFYVLFISSGILSLSDLSHTA